MPIDTDTLIDDWFNDNFYNNALSRSEGAFNVAQDAKEKLKAKLKAALGAPAPLAAAPQLSQLEQPAPIQETEHVNE